MNLRNQALVNDGFEPAFTPEVIAKFENPLAGLDPNDPDYEEKAALRKWMYPDNDWYDILIAVSYTHLDVYKRQGAGKAKGGGDGEGEVFRGYQNHQVARQNHVPVGRRARFLRDGGGGVVHRWLQEIYYRLRGQLLGDFVKEGNRESYRHGQKQKQDV